jgi:MFS transporter, ACDE family, multidrug resistance protein
MSGSHDTRVQARHSAAEVSSAPSPFRQPKAVWAVAFACVISFMGVGLVDPILPSLASQLQASPSQVELLFTSYLVVTALAMLITGWVSSRLGAKRTLIVGLVLIVVFSAIAGTSGSIGEIVGFRAGWGLGNALFIATSLAVIVGSASGGFSGAIVLYEAALGVGIACGPLLGGLLGNVSWRGPFFGVAVLMLIALVATAILVPPTPRPTQRSSVSEPIKALRYRSLATTSATGLLYNWAFFTILGYAPFLMHLSALKLGGVFCGWGVLVAIFAVFGAPVLKARFGTARTLYMSMVLMAVDSLVIGVFHEHPEVVIGATIASGIFIGSNNTLVTTAVMSIAPVPRPVASATYGFVRFIGGGFAPFVAGKLVEHYNTQVPFILGAVTALAGAVVLSTVHRALREADREEAHAGTSHQRMDAEQAVRDMPGLPEEAILAETALIEDRTLNDDTVDNRAVNARELASVRAGDQDVLNGLAAAQAPAQNTVYASAERRDDSGGGGIRGFIRGADGTPVGHATLTLIDVRGHQLGRAVTHPDGGYSLWTPGSGTYVLIASATEHDPQVATLVVGDHPLDFDLVLAGSGKLTGTVRDPDGTPVPQAMVIVTDVRGEVVTTGTTGEDGAFNFAGVVAGTYTLAVSAAAHRPVAVPVEVGAGQTRQDIELLPGAHVRGTVRVEDGGGPLADARVTLLDSAGNVVGTATTGEDGEYAFADLTDGQYTLIATGYPPMASALNLTGQGDDEHDLWLGHAE